MKKICCFFNMAPKYNEEIYVALDKNFDCTFIIGQQRENIKEMDLTLLSNLYQPSHKIIMGKFAYEKGAFKKIINSSCDIFITTMEPYNITLWMLKLYCIIKGKKIYYWTHGWYGKEGLIKRLIKKIDYKTTSGFFLYGNYAKSLMIKEGFRKDNLFVIHNSLNYSNQIKIRKMLSSTSIYKDHFGNDNPVIIFVGRLTKVKQLDLLINVVKQLNNENQSFNLVLIGDGTERKHLEELAKCNNLSSSVWFYGECYDDFKNAELIYNADICVSPGNVGLTAMHSLVFGCPVITHNDFSMQMPEFEAIKEGKTGSFFRYGDLVSLKDCVSSWMANNNNKREKVREACYYEIDNYWTPQYELNVLKQVIN